MADDKAPVYTNPDRPRSWRWLLWIIGAIVLVVGIWWLIEFTGNNATRDLENSKTEPLEPAAVRFQSVA